MVFNEHGPPAKGGPSETILVNPEIVARSRKTETDEEGCLSFPKIYADVEVRGRGDVERRGDPPRGCLGCGRVARACGVLAGGVQGRRCSAGRGVKKPPPAAAGRRRPAGPRLGRLSRADSAAADARPSAPPRAALSIFRPPPSPARGAHRRALL